MRTRKIVLFWVKLIAICCILAVVINTAGSVLTNGDDVIRNAAALKTLPRNSVDVFFCGTSHAHYDVIPQLLYDEYGVTSTMVSGNSVDFSQSYWQIRQALLRQKPEVIVLDVYPAAAPYCYFYVQNVLATQTANSKPRGSNAYNTASSMARWLPLGSPYKIPAIAEAYNSFGLEGEAYFEMTRFHSRYGELRRGEFQNVKGQKRHVHNFGYLYGDNVLDYAVVDTQPYSPEAALVTNEAGTFWTFTDEQIAQAEMNKKTVADLKRIVDFTRRKGIELVLCVAPYATNVVEKKLFAEVEKLAAEWEVPFVRAEDSPANEEKYFRDLGHLNDAGARINTVFWGEYFSKHYSLSDRRTQQDARYQPWRERAGSYDQQHAAMQLRRYEGGLTGYLEAISALASDHLLLFTIKGDVYDGFTEDDYWLMVDELGIPEEELETWSYAGCGTLDLLLMDGELMYSNYAYGGRREADTRSIRGYDVSFGENRWYVNGKSAGDIETGFNVSVYSMIDEKLMDFRAFDMTEIYLDE